jgi:RNA polymerase sigma factor (sigma-70 family)
MPQTADQSLEDARLLAAVADGDREAFRDLYARCSAPLFSLAVRLLGDPGPAEEALQDAFVKIWRHAADYDERKSRPFTWAVTIMRRTCIDYIRKHRRAPGSVPLPDDATATPEFSTRENIRQTPRRGRRPISCAPLSPRSLDPNAQRSNSRCFPRSPTRKSQRASRSPSGPSRHGSAAACSTCAPP